MRSHDYPTQTGAQLLVDALRIQGVDTIFCVPGESFLSVLDALRDAKDDIRLIVCRHEGAAANMAEAYGKLTGTPGICIVSRGPGATHASIGVHTAKQNSTPGCADRARLAGARTCLSGIPNGCKWPPRTSGTCTSCRHVNGNRCSCRNQTLPGRARASGSSGFAATQCDASSSKTSQA